jgi:ATP-dependent helicase YprA (DUF1998 family)
MGKIHDQAYQHPLLSQTIDVFLHNQFVSGFTSDSHRQIDSEDLKKAGWLASILANSHLDQHKQNAQLFAALLFLQYPQSIEATQLSYVVLARTGNLIATKFFSNLFIENGSTPYADKTFAHSFGSLLDIEVGVDRLEKTVEIGTEKFLLSGFQKNLWESLVTENRVSISAPTSAGKSFIIQRYIQQKYLSESTLDVLYIVPSRALLNQVSQEFTQLLSDNVKINTAFIEEQLVGRLNKEEGGASKSMMT